MDSGRKMIAVIGTGIDSVYFSRNKKLAQQLIEHGVLVSEFAIGKSHILLTSLEGIKLLVVWRSARYW